MFKAELTVEEARSGMANLKPKLERYADLIVRKGVNVKPGQEVVVQAPVEVAAFVRLLVARAYAVGAGHVTVIWNDDAVMRLTYENVDASWFETVPAWQREQLDSLAEAGACFIFVEGADPEALKGIDPAKPAAASKARNTQCVKYRHGMDFNINPWCIAGAPVAAWRDRCIRVSRTRLRCTVCGARSSPLPALTETIPRPPGSCTMRRSKRTCVCSTSATSIDCTIPPRMAPTCGGHDR